MPFFKTEDGTTSWSKPKAGHLAKIKAEIFPVPQNYEGSEVLVREIIRSDDVERLLSAGAVDIVVPVYNGLHVLKSCLESVKRCTKYPYNLILVDDCSDEATQKYLGEAAVQYNAKLIFNKVNKGFAATCNRGILAGTSPFVVLLNSDTVVTDGWLTKMVLAITADPRNVICNPCTNNTAMIAIPMGEGNSYKDMSRMLGKVTVPSYPEINPTGFCFMIKRSLVSEIGLLDESFRSYGEETDFWMRALKCAAPEFKHYRAVLADDSYVFHERGGSFSALDSAAWMRQRTDGNNRFKQLHPDYGTWATNFDAKGTLAYLKDLDPVPNPDMKYSVAFVTHSTAMCGGMKFISDIVNEMIEQDIDAKVCCILRPGDSKKTMEVISDLRCQPLVFESYEDFETAFLTRGFREGVVIAATAELVATVQRLCEANPSLKPMLHAQSYDIDIASTDEQRAMVHDAYSSMRSNTIACGRAIARKIEYHSGDIQDDIPVVHPGVDVDLFYPGNREAGDDRPTLLMFMAEKYVHKGKDLAIEVADEVHRLAPGVRIMAIGSTQVMDRAWITCLGNLAQSRLAGLLRTEVDYVFDPANVHSYGMPALEALASGCAVGMMATDGSNEYAHLFNQANVFAMGVDPADIAAKIVEQLTVVGRVTAAATCHAVGHIRKQQAKEFVKVLESKMNREIRIEVSSKPKVTFITPHVRKQGGPTTIVEAANALALRGYDVNVRSVYRDNFNWDLMNDCKVPLYFGLKNMPPCDIVVMPSDSDQHAFNFPAKKKVMFKLSHNPRFKTLEEDGLKAGYDAILTSSQWLADACKTPLEGWNHPPVEAKRVGWFHHGFKYFNVHPSQRRYNKLNQTPMIVCGLIHNHPLKGTETFMQVGDALYNKYGDMVHIYGIGEVPTSNQPKWLRYIFSPTRKQLANLLSQSDFWLGCSLSEGLGRMGLEAMGVGAACVLSNTGAEYVRDGKNSLLFTPGNPSQALECLEFLMNDQVFRGKLVYNAWETASAVANPEPFLNALDAAFRELLK